MADPWGVEAALLAAAAGDVFGMASSSSSSFPAAQHNPTELDSATLVDREDTPTQAMDQVAPTAFDTPVPDDWDFEDAVDPQAFFQGQFVTDEEGLDIAYQQRSGVYVVGNTMYLAGTKSLGDAFDDARLPLGNVRGTARYRSAVNAWDPEINHVVGHSLGGSVARAVAADKGVSHRTYSEPRFSAGARADPDAFRTVGDPIAMFGAGDETFAPREANVHSYHSMPPAKVRRFVGPGARDPERRKYQRVM